MIPLATGDRSKLTPAIHRHYLAALPTPADRRSTWVFARELIGSSAWYDGLWQRRELLCHKPALLLWGLKDPAFGRAALARWQELLPQARTVEFEDTGHFVQEEQGAESARLIGEFLHESADRA
jgi:haloalkane dehalogenase